MSWVLTLTLVGHNGNGSSMTNVPGFGSYIECQHAATEWKATMSDFLTASTVCVKQAQ